MYIEKVKHVISTVFNSNNPQTLGLIRIVIISLILIFTVPPYKWLYNLALTNDSFIDPNLLTHVFSFILGEELLLSPLFLKLIYIMIFVSGVLTVIGFYCKYNLPILAFLYTFIVAYLWSFGEIHHPRSTLCWFLIILAISGRSSDSYSLDSYLDIEKVQPELWKYGWPNSMMMIALSSAYCFSGLWKLFYQGGVEWLNGLTMQYYLSSKGENYLTQFIVDKRWLLIMLSIFSVGFEILFPLALFFRKYSKWFLLAAFLFHLGNYIIRAENGIFILWPFVAVGYCFSLDKFRFIK